MAQDHQSSYTGSQMDAAIASYANRSTGQIILTPDQLNGSLSDGYYSGVSASFDCSNLTAESSHVLSGKSAVGKYGKITNGGIANNGAGSITLDKDNLSKSIGGGYYSGVSASLNYSSLTAEADDALSGKTLIGANGLETGTLIDGISTYVSDTITFSTGTTLNDYVIDIGFVPNLFFFYYAGSGVTIPSDYRLVTSTFYSKNVNVGTYYSEIYRGLHAYRGSSTATLVSYVDYNFRPYDNGSVKGVIGVSGSNYKMNGTYRWFGIKTTENAISS